MKSEAKEFIFLSLKTANEAVRSGNHEEAWFHLEDAHVVSQPSPWLHTRVHLSMLSLAFKSVSLHEIFGQIFRILLAGVGSLFGKYPLGNTDRSDVSAFREMPIPIRLLPFINP